jgi:phosphoglycolate phosphatase
MTIPRDTLKTPGAIFDLDGTILDTLTDIMDSLNYALEALGFPHRSKEEYLFMVSTGTSRLTMDSLPEEERTEENARKVWLNFRKEYAIHRTDATIPFPGIPKLLLSLKNAGWPLAVLSNKDHENTTAIIKHFFPDIFDAILGASPDRPHKPDTTGAMEAVRILGREPHEVYYFGDSRIDMLLAQKMGFFPVGVSWGMQSREIIQEAGAMLVLDHPDEFFDFLKSREVTTAREESV